MIVGTPEQAAALSLVPLLIREPLQRFLDEHGIGEGEIDAEPVGEGHSNVTYALLFLTSDASSYVTGHILAVDGGWTSV